MVLTALLLLPRRWLRRMLFFSEMDFLETWIFLPLNCLAYPKWAVLLLNSGARLWSKV